MEAYLKSYCDNFIKNFSNEDSDSLMSLLEDKEDDNDESLICVISKKILNADYQYLFQLIYSNISFKLQNKTLELQLSEFLAYYFLFIQSNKNKNYKEGFDNLKKSFNSLTQIYQNMSNTKISLILKYFIKLLYNTVIKIDIGNDEKLSSNNENLSECARIFITFFSKLQKFDNSDELENQLLVLYSSVCLMKLYFKLKTYRNSITLINWFEKMKFDVSEIPKDNLTTFSYFQGRLNLYQLNLLEANTVLNNCFELCVNNKSVNAQKNAKIIYEYLIPLQMFKGIYPKNEIINKFGIDKNYLELSEAIKKGDVFRFEDILDKLEDRLIQLGTFLIVGKIRPFVYRNLIYIIYKSIEGDLEKMKTPNIKLMYILAVINNIFEYKDIDIEELELNIIGVLYRGLIGGYIHNVNKVIVFSKKNPFPQLKEVFQENYDKII